MIDHQSERLTDSLNTATLKIRVNTQAPYVLKRSTIPNTEGRAKLAGAVKKHARVISANIPRSFLPSLKLPTAMKIRDTIDNNTTITVITYTCMKD